VERTRDLQQARDELERLSTLDGLTQIYNRRRFDQVLGSEWQRAIRDRRPLSLILCDVDHFKLYNDHFGHHAGDLVLIRVAACVADAARRPGDLPARFGGEEFALVMPDTELAGAIEVAERLCRSVRDAELLRDDLGERDRVTLSIGVACCVPVSERSPDDLIEAADRQLYAAKDAGRDRVMPLSS
ncbi:MAG TPA: diguanylate cyclase, partial [Arenimonas sp.]|nr:diguanylate cyclase [Arenimonas sp.]